ncbi:MAG TPA: pyridoxine 5'-phosphate synthase [Polyangiaceae bacterium]|nr:pyridoxine 5'-phosphate synthase [Polyangiaceae bacterium]
MTKLSVNVNKIATLRNTRTLEIPSLTHLSTIALRAGAHGITVHPRPDQRHIRPDDVPAIAAVVASFAGAEYNIEGNPFHGLVEHCESVKPTQATLVPDAREAFTSNHGWNLVELFAPERKALAHAIERLHVIGCRVSLFMDPVADMMPIARELGADRVELYTEPYAAAHASAKSQAQASAVVERYAEAARAAIDQGLQVNAGHDLSLANLPDFLRAIPSIAEVSIGHALIADALEFGLADTVRRYLRACGN